MNAKIETLKTQITQKTNIPEFNRKEIINALDGYAFTLECLPDEIVDPEYLKVEIQDRWNSIDDLVSKITLKWGDLPAEENNADDFDWIEWECLANCG